VQRFHRSLQTNPSAGFSHSFSVAIGQPPWLPASQDAYEDWYLVRDSAALDPLNDAAIAGARQPAHDEAAVAAAGGTAGLYRLRLGTSGEPPSVAYWFAKPPGTSYHELYESLRPIVRNSGGALWGRQMTLGPAPEFCLHARGDCALPVGWSTVVVPLRLVWPLDRASAT
jgi:hypothetical protein